MPVRPPVRGPPWQQSPSLEARPRPLTRFPRQYRSPRPRPLMDISTRHPGPRGLWQNQGQQPGHHIHPRSTYQQFRTRERNVSATAEPPCPAPLLDPSPQDHFVPHEQYCGAKQSHGLDPVDIHNMPVEYYPSHSYGLRAPLPNEHTSHGTPLLSEHQVSQDLIYLSHKQNLSRYPAQEAHSPQQIPRLQGLQSSSRPTHQHQTHSLLPGGQPHPRQFQHLSPSLSTHERSSGVELRFQNPLSYNSAVRMPPQPPLPAPRPMPPPPPPPKIEVTTVEELFDDPGRSSRQSQFVIILRGPPGTGKSHVAKLLKEKEVEHNGVAVRILSLDDYFLTEVDSTNMDHVTGKKSRRKTMEYCYDAEMEQLYKDSLFKTFCKTLDDPDFPIVIIDSVNHKLVDFEKFWSQAKVKGYEVFVAELMSDVEECVAQSSHGRSHEDIGRIIKEWEETPSHCKRLDVRSLHQAVAINEVEMEIGEEASAQLPKSDSEASENAVKVCVHFLSLQ